MDESESGASNFFFGSGAEAAGQAFCEVALSSAEIAGKQNQKRRCEPSADFAAAGDGVFAGVSFDFELSHARIPRRNADRHEARHGSDPMR